MEIKMLARTIILTLFLLMAGGMPVTAEGVAVNRLSGKVVKVLDGDSFFMQQNGEYYEIRLWGIDCPERGQPYGAKARTLGKTLLDKQMVRVEVVGRDSYGRYLGIVYRGRLLVNEEMIRQGAAWVYRRYCSKAICDSWYSAEQMAQAGRIGLWAEPQPVPPWKWRHN